MQRYRWAVLAAGTAAQAGYSAVALGVAVLLPELRDTLGLSLGETGVVLAAPAVGSMLSLLPWGIAADRVGERRVVVAGLAGAAVALWLAGRAGSFEALTVSLALAGLLGAGVNAASGRAVMQWFGPGERGLALGIRQTAVPIGGAFAALALPHVAAAGGTRWGLWALALGCLVGALAAGLVLREAGDGEDEGALDTRPLRDAQLWRLLGASGLLLLPQAVIFGYAVLFLHEQRGLSSAAAAAVLASVQVLGIGARIGAGRWSDVVGSRTRPLRLIALGSAALAVATGSLVGAPLAVLVPVLVAGGVLAMSWNGLSFAAAAELAGRARSGAALGLQQTALAVGAAVVAPLFAAAVGAVGWGPAWALMAIGPAAAALLLRGLRA